MASKFARGMSEKIDPRYAECVQLKNQEPDVVCRQSIWTFDQLVTLNSKRCV